MFKKNLPFLLIFSSNIIGFIILAIVLTTNIGATTIKSEEQIQLSRKIVLDLEINQIIQSELVKGNTALIYDFYNKFTHNEEITFYIIHYALEYEIPVNMLFALSKQESGFNAKAIGKNDNNTYDYGLMQLNSNTFKEWIKNNSKESIFIIKNNVRLSAQFLAEKYAIYNNWTEAFISYNAGNTIKIGNHTIKHFHNVLKYEKEFDVAFNERFYVAYSKKKDI